MNTDRMEVRKINTFDLGKSDEKFIKVLNMKYIIRKVNKHLKNKER